MQPPTELPSKLEIANTLLENGTLFVHLDPRIEGVVVPPWYRDQPQLVIQLGLEMPIPIPDLRVEESGLHGTLSFNRSPFYCQVPWQAVFALAGEDGRGMVWPESMPPEIEAEIDREAGRRPPVEPTKELSESEPEFEAEAKAKPKQKPKRSPKPREAGAPRRELPPYLKIIK